MSQVIEESHLNGLALLSRQLTYDRSHAHGLFISISGIRYVFHRGCIRHRGLGRILLDGRTHDPQTATSRTEAIDHPAARHQHGPTKNAALVNIVGSGPAAELEKKIMERIFRFRNVAEQPQRERVERSAQAIVKLTKSAL